MADMRIPTDIGEFSATVVKDGVALTRPDGQTATISQKEFAQFLIEAQVNVDKTPDKDVVEKSADKAKEKEAAAPPDIPFWRIAMSRLTDEQINHINEHRRLPKNAKFAKTVAGYNLANNMFGTRIGTRTLPDEYELSKTWTGFTVIVPKDSESIFLQND